MQSQAKDWRGAGFSSRNFTRRSIASLRLSDGRGLRFQRSGADLRLERRHRATQSPWNVANGTSTATPSPGVSSARRARPRRQSIGFRWRGRGGRVRGRLSRRQAPGASALRAVARARRGGQDLAGLRLSVRPRIVLASVIKLCTRRRLLQQMEHDRRCGPSSPRSLALRPPGRRKASAKTKTKQAKEGLACGPKC
jgi:hypothetical protein